MQKLWIKISFSYVIAFFLTFITAIFLIIFISNMQMEAIDEETLILDEEHQIDYFVVESLLEEAIISDNVDKTKDSIKLRVEENLEQLVLKLKDEGFDKGIRPERNRSQEIKEILLYSITPLVLIVLVASGLFGIILGLILSRSITSPLGKLVKATTLIGNRDLNAKVSIKGAKEFHVLANSFNNMTEQLKSIEEQKKNMTADIAHELRTPLAVLESNLRASLDNISSLDEERVANLYTQTNHLIRLVKDLRELSLAESNQLPIDRTHVNINKLLGEIKDIFIYAAEEKSIKLQLVVPENIVTLNIDESRIRQVLHNLLHNAFRHTPYGGTISIELNIGNNSAIISVIDNGDGISMDKIQNVFSRLYRVDPSRNKGKGGTGLGLAIVKAIVENHGGTVIATSPGLEKGSCFSIMLPL